jgi:hypothetical protein
VASTSEKRLWWADWRCNPLKMTAVTFPGSERDWNLPVADAAVPAFQLFASLMRKHDYLFREVSGGTYNCRYIGGTTQWSLHAYGIAIDLNPSVNKFGTTQHDYPQGFIEDVLATGLFKWLHSFDPMHWEIDVPPSQIGDDPAMKPPTWARDATQWHIDRGIYSGPVDSIDEELEFHRQTVFRHRFYNAIRGEFGGSGGSDSVARAEASRAHSRLDGIRIPG